MEQIERIAKNARAASRLTARLSTAQKNSALNAMADALEKQSQAILSANEKDMSAGKENGLSEAMLDRLKLDDKRVKGMADSMREISALPDPVGEITGMKRRPNGLMVGQMRVPLGVLGIIYESRPNVTADASALCLKSGNAVILRGGSEAFNSNMAIATILSGVAKENGIPENAIQLIPVTSREAVRALLRMDKYIDIIIPRGGYELIRTVTENSTIPVIKHDKGMCHVYVDKDADMEMAERIVFNSKVQRPGVCNAAETLLVHREVAEKFLPMVADRLTGAGVEIRGCAKTLEIIPSVTRATEQDWDEEYLGLTLAVKVVDSFDDAVEHIAEHGSEHTETIVTDNYQAGKTFLEIVDSSAVIVNASTRFNDGGQFGLGAEMGISTQKLHVRGPMGLADLTCLKYVVLGEGQIRE